MTDYEVRKSLFCNHLNCMHCMKATPYDAFSGRVYMCDKFGDRTYHGLVFAKWCDQFMCAYPDCENDIALCINCRGYKDYEEQEL